MAEQNGISLRVQALAIEAARLEGEILCADAQIAILEDALQRFQALHRWHESGHPICTSSNPPVEMTHG